MVGKSITWTLGRGRIYCSLSVCVCVYVDDEEGEDDKEDEDAEFIEGLRGLLRCILPPVCCLAALATTTFKLAKFIYQLVRAVPAVVRRGSTGNMPVLYIH